MEDFRELRGIKGLKLAVQKTDTTAAITYDTPTNFAGVRSVENEEDESTGESYYDNQPAIVTSSEGADTYKLVTSVLDDVMRAIIEGRKHDEETGAYFGTPKNRPYLALGFIATDTNGDDWYYWIYKGKLTGGSEKHNTKDNGTEGTNLEWEFKSIYTNHKFTSANNQPLKYYKIKAGGKISEEQFFSKVYNPDTPDA